MTLEKINTSDDTGLSPLDAPENSQESTSEHARASIARRIRMAILVILSTTSLALQRTDAQYHSPSERTLARAEMAQSDPDRFIAWCIQNYALNEKYPRRNSLVNIDGIHANPLLLPQIALRGKGIIDPKAIDDTVSQLALSPWGDAQEQTRAYTGAIETIRIQMNNPETTQWTIENLVERLNWICGNISVLKPEVQFGLIESLKPVLTLEKLKEYVQHATHTAQKEKAHELLIQYRNVLSTIIGIPEATTLLKTAVEADPVAAHTHLTQNDIPDQWDFVERETALSAEAREWPNKTIDEHGLPFDAPHTLDLVRWVSRMKNEHHAKLQSRAGIEVPLIRVPRVEFESVIISPAFQSEIGKRAGSMTYANMLSVAHAVVRRVIDSSSEHTEPVIATITAEILEEIDAVRTKVLLGPDTKLILMTHEEWRFQQNHILDLYGSAGGTRHNIQAVEKGVEMHGKVNIHKERILEAVASSSGPTTMIFSGHGSNENIAFAHNESDNLTETLGGDPRCISYIELGDAILRSADPSHISFVFSTCRSYNFTQNLRNYLIARGVTNLPEIIIAATNENENAYGTEKDDYPNNDDPGEKHLGPRGFDDRLLDAIDSIHAEGTPVTVDHFMRAEGLVYLTEDPSIFIALPNKEPETLSGACIADL